MNKDRRYTAIQKVRRLNAEHHSANVKLVDSLKNTADVLERRPRRGEYHKTERRVLSATSKHILAVLRMDARLKKLRISTQRLDRLVKKIFKQPKKGVAPRIF